MSTKPLTKVVTLSRGITLNDKTYKEVELRESYLDDMCAAEDIVPSSFYIRWRKELIALCIVSVKGYDGIITGSLLGRITQKDYSLLNAALTELGSEGEG